MKNIFLINKTNRHHSVYQPNVIERMSEVIDIDRTFYTSSDLAADPAAFSEVETVFSTWGMPNLTEKEIKEYLPNLKCVFYAAGSVQAFARPFLNCGIKIISAWAANAIPVAEYSAAQIVLANKGFFPLSRMLSQKKISDAWNGKYSYHGNFKERVGLLGCGMIGSHVAELLKKYELDVLVFDPFLSDEKAEQLNVRKCSIEELFSTCSVVSNHLASNDATKGMLNYSHFSSMRPYATFINTGRGAQVVEQDLVKALTERPDLTVLLDVTLKEPAEPEHPFYTLPNCFMTPHIAGNIIANEQVRMVEYLLEEYERYVSGKPLKYEVTPRMLETMA